MVPQSFVTGILRRRNGNKGLWLHWKRAWLLKSSFLWWFQVFQLQVNNGIPIKSWFDDPSDHALISLLPFLESLVDADDVRPIIAKRFGNKE